MQKLAAAFILAALVLLAAACGTGGAADAGKVIKSATVGGGLTVTMSNKDGVLRDGDNEFLLSFKDSTGKPVEVTAVALKFYMPPMGTMPAMTDAATFTTTGAAGTCQGKVKLEAAGEWQVQVSYESPAGSGKTSFPVTAQ